MNDWTLYKIDVNHRCRRAIVEAANRLISHNTERYPKEAVASREGGRISVVQCETPAHEMAHVLSELLALPQGDTAAVLTRTNVEANAIRDYLRCRGVQVAEREQVKQPPDWKLCKLYLSLMANLENDFLAYQWVESQTSTTEAEKIKSDCARRMVSINTGYMHYQQTVNIQNLDLDAFCVASRDRVKEAMRHLSLLGEWSLPELIAALHVEERGEMGAGFYTGTFHSSKGLQWKHVFICGFEDETIPGRKKDTDESEERRLSYVAITRAEDRFVISFCKTRPESRRPNLPPGKPLPRTPSRFISEMGLTV